MMEATNSKENMVVGFALYRPQQGQRVRDISPDAEELENTYKEWLRLAEEKLTELRCRFAGRKS